MDRTCKSVHTYSGTWSVHDSSLAFFIADENVDIDIDDQVRAGSPTLTFYMGEPDGGDYFSLTKAD